MPWRSRCSRPAASRARDASSIPAIAAHPTATSAQLQLPRRSRREPSSTHRMPSNMRTCIPAATMLAIQHGLRLEVQPTHRMQWSKGFQTATEKYSPQVGLDKDDYITNYIAGMPFPLIDTNDPKAAVKIAYNWHFGPVLPDDFSLSPWSVNGYLADAREPTANSSFQRPGQRVRAVRFPALRASHRSGTASDDGIERARRRMESALQPVDYHQRGRRHGRGRGNLDSLF